MSFPLILPMHQFFDSSGSPLVSGSLEFRNPTTNALIKSYPTADDADAQTNENANPLTLDARGGFTGLYLEDGVKYKLILKDADGATVDTQDDVLCPRVANYFGITAAETSAGVTPTNYQYEPGNVLRYGTNTTPGTTDMTTAVQAAVDVIAQRGRGKVFIPAGTYLVDTIVLPTAIEISIVGESGSILKASASATTIIVIPNDITRGGYRSIRDIEIDGNDVANVIGISSGNTTSAALYTHMERVFVRRCEIGIDLYTAMEHTFVSVTCYQCTIGLKLRQDATNGGGNSNGFYKCAFQSNTVGVFYDGVSAFPMRSNGFNNCLLQSNTLCGFAAFSAEGSLQFVTCHFEGNGSAGTTLSVDSRTVTKSAIQLDAADASLVDVTFGETADPGILLQNRASISLQNAGGYGATGGTFISGSLSESVRFYGNHAALGKVTCHVSRWPDNFTVGNQFSAIGDPVIEMSAQLTNDFVASSPSTPLLQNAVVATINSDAGDAEMGMVSSASYTTAIGTASTNRVTINALPTGISSGDTCLISMMVKSSISTDMAFAVTSGSFVTFVDCPVDTKWRRLILAFTAGSTNTPLLYAYSPNSDAPTVKFANLQALILGSGDDLSVASEMLSRGLVNIQQNEYFYTAAPTVGTWKAGDIFHDTAPTAGGTIGWICTVAGTPGTWKTFGTITA